ncbi:MAG: alcohol dehydrogenase catalytic domain-containing protein [Pseudomonadales bacterium]|jgi:threonine dehydrogenase-like Zn-dependent dehydrogenase|nr:alcohol dehydrogenase catalytic domain-containing protein [Pseudomonadales bacterium]MBP7910488.1 alcohol dehydrogenase catalytic domain-containing protein [Pseudomonadales bacterium]
MSATAMYGKAVVLHAEDAPRPDTPDPGPHQRYRAPRLAVESRTLAPPAPGRLQVEMLYAGVCGTDLHLLQTDPLTGYVRTSAPATIPPQGRVIGHEGVGRVIAAGDGAGGLRAGSIVAFDSIIACLRCPVCRRGAPNQCPEALLLGMQADGLFATLVDVPASLAHDVTAYIDSDRDLRAAACLEPAGCALLACESARIAPGERVLVFGGGPIGLFAAMLCRRVFGATHVTLVEPLARRRALAADWCDTVHDSGEFLGTTIPPVDVMIEASGRLDNVDRAFRRLAPSARVMLLGRSGTALSIAAVDHMITNAISVAGSRGHLGGVLPRVIGLYRAGLLPLPEVVTGVLESLEDLALALREPDAIAGEHCKLLVRIGS